jgi:nucleotidyltransferase substrate binding protein (TIGR01987 family)
MPIELDALSRAIERLQEGWAEHQREPGRTIVRDGLIQRFEFTYEISHRTLKRYLQAISASPDEYDAMPFQDLIRSGNEVGLLLGGWPAWRSFRHMRSLTSHTYAESLRVNLLRVPIAALSGARPSPIYLICLGAARRPPCTRAARDDLFSGSEAVALEVVAGIPAFMQEAAYLRDALARRLCP